MGVRSRDRGGRGTCLRTNVCAVFRSASSALQTLRHGREEIDEREELRKESKRVEDSFEREKRVNR